MNPLFIFLIMNPSLWWSMVFPSLYTTKKKTDKESNAVDN